MNIRYDPYSWTAIQNDCGIWFYPNPLHYHVALDTSPQLHKEHIHLLRMLVKRPAGRHLEVLGCISNLPGIALPTSGISRCRISVMLDSGEHFQVVFGSDFRMKPEQIIWCLSQVLPSLHKTTKPLRVTVDENRTYEPERQLIVVLSRLLQKLDVYTNALSRNAVYVLVYLIKLLIPAVEVRYRSA